MAYGGPFHRALHGAAATAGGDIEAPQAQLVAHVLGEVVFLAGDRVSTPAHHQSGREIAVDDTAVAQYPEYGVGYSLRTVEVEVLLLHQFVVGENDVAQGRKQVGANPLDHLAVDESLGRAVVKLQFQAPGLGDYFHLEVLVLVVELPRVVHVSPGVHHRQGTAAEQLVNLRPRRGEAGHLPLGQQVQALHRPYRCIGYFIVVVHRSTEPALLPEHPLRRRPQVIYQIPAGGVGLLVVILRFAQLAAQALAVAANGCHGIGIGAQ